VNEHTGTADPTGMLAERLTRWFEARLDETVAPRGAFAQLFGLEVVDADGIDDGRPDAVRVYFICEGPDEFSVLAAPGTACVCDFDAAATVEYGWQRRRSSAGRPGQFARKDRTRTVRVMLNDE
jgi:hypothetical protein